MKKTAKSSLHLYHWSQYFPRHHFQPQQLSYWILQLKLLDMMKNFSIPKNNCINLGKKWLLDVSSAADRLGDEILNAPSTLTLVVSMIQTLAPAPTPTLAALSWTWCEPYSSYLWLLVTLYSTLIVLVASWSRSFCISFVITLLFSKFIRSLFFFSCYSFTLIIIIIIIIIIHMKMTSRHTIFLNGFHYLMEHIRIWAYIGIYPKWLILYVYCLSCQWSHHYCHECCYSSVINTKLHW